MIYPNVNWCATLIHNVITVPFMVESVTWVILVQPNPWLESKALITSIIEVVSIPQKSKKYFAPLNIVIFQSQPTDYWTMLWIFTKQIPNSEARYGLNSSTLTLVQVEMSGYARLNVLYDTQIATFIGIQDLTATLVTLLDILILILVTQTRPSKS